MTAPETHQVAGVDVVTIPAAEYADLLDCRRRLAELKLVRRRFKTPSTSRIDRDPEVAVFIAERLGMQYLHTIREECLKRFGADRTPGLSTIHRYWERLRRRPARSRRTAPT